MLSLSHKLKTEQGHGPKF